MLAEETSGVLPATVLLVEDEPLIAMTAEMMLEDLGVSMVRTAYNVADAMAALDRGGIDLAILDYNLGRESSVPIAERLLKEGVRFAFASGAWPADLPENLLAAKFVTKPYSLRELGKILRA